jgi:lipopolysaccharide biosynthesis glycosyltransferase
LDPLVRAVIPEGRFMACRDPANLFADLSPARQTRLLERRERLGLLGEPEDYFNSGVLVIDRDGWPPMARACIEAYVEMQALCLHPDQDALNIAIGDRCIFISNKWNFPGFLIGSAAEAARHPHIYHFMSNPRPWKVSVGPWGARWCKPYQDLLLAHPELEELAPRKRLGEQIRYTLQQELKIWTEYRRVGKIAAESAVYDLA